MLAFRLRLLPLAVPLAPTVLNAAAAAQAQPPRGNDNNNI